MPYFRVGKPVQHLKDLKLVQQVVFKPERYLSIPKIISGRIDDANRTRSVWRRWSRTVGRLVVAVRPCPTPSACASRYNRANTRSGPVANAVRGRSAHDPGSRASASRSTAQHMRFATATSVISAGLESPSPRFDV